MADRNLPEKYRYRNCEKDESQIFSYDTQGWPQYEQTVRDALIGFGLDYDSETDEWKIKDDDPRLNCVLRRLVDDGMGYGVDEEYVEEISCIQNGEGYYCNIFTEKEEKNIDIWLATKFYPGAWVRKFEPYSEITNLYCLREVKKNESGEIVFDADQYCKMDNGDICKLKRVEVKDGDIEFD